MDCKDKNCGLKAALSSLLAGLVFGLGLIAAGMTDPMKVRAFLDLAGAWDPSLALVMGAAIAVGLPAALIARRRGRSWSGAPIEWPQSNAIDARLIGGGVLFGIGWGLAGLCPGPALVALGSGWGEAAIFVAAMLGGMALHALLDRPR
ncbi:putative membrane protein YedE/YeeE [Sphaerotilus sulfidivorans]|uniref:Membrane protein YedE/YeeE n=1 Tax=Sphaerotilus sulfidivorans TaxID=639200 RepID=A0A5C1PZN2_9BURK|nr:DUF6691 family protein [Sphaerotilus sulfidivorans]NZD46513.1 hypothetical protein [Sphaerotilus sulfidivorans]QEN00668.1 hypothetical protein EWH46_07675 [Sphaerotilus sulfidivorans]